MDTHFDFIIVGAGSAGCALAARLSEHGRFSVLLLEAGGEAKGRWIRIPIGIGKLLADRSRLWPFETEPEHNMKGQKLYWPRGKMLGGSSSVNGMVFVRGDASEYDRWRDADCPGWGHADVLPALKRLEDRPEGDPRYRGRGGPIRVTDIAHKDALTEAFFDACVASGMPTTSDYNAQQYEGVSYMQMSVANGQRCSTEVGYLREARRRTNLRVETGALVDRLIVEGSRAVGVSYRASGASAAHRQEATANREIILCAGALCSPQILERSGVGDSSRLESLGITPVEHLSGVGESLQDHVNVRTTYECTQAITVNDLLNDWVLGAKAGVQYALLRSGLMATPTVSVQAYVKSQPSLRTPDFKLQLAHVSGGDRFAMAKGLGVDEFSGFSLQAFKLHPRSRGSIHIRSASPDDSPVINANYLQHREDQAAAVKCLEMLRELASQASLEAMTVREVRPGAAVTSYDALLDYAKACGQTCWHSVGTCAMGAGQSAVVDSRLKVHGIDALRVADGSVIPHLVSSNTNVPVIMVAERCSDFIWEEHGGASI